MRRGFLAALPCCLLVASQGPFEEQEPCLGEYAHCPDGSCSLGPCGAGCAPGEYLCPLESVCAPRPQAYLACPGVAGSHLDPALPHEQRLDILVRDTTLEEKVGQLTAQAPGIARLGIPAYNWLDDALHGVQTKNASSKSTIFPDGCGLGATWSKATLREVGAAIAMEARGWKNTFTHRGDRGQESLWENVGVTLYTPNVNLARDPRWGRASEVYGEDPEHMSRLAAAFVKGVQQGVDDGGGPVLLAAATCKHLTAYHQEEFPSARDVISVNVTNRDMWESYLPAFEACVREAGALQVMCSFNEINGVPTCADRGLLTHVLREQWGFSGSVVGDFDAWKNFRTTQNYSRSWPEAAATGLNAGMDQEGGGTAAMNASNVARAIQLGLTTKDAIAAAFRRLFRVRLALGLLDPPAGPGSPPAAIRRLTRADAATPSHLALARRAAQQSICLYKNEGGALPLRPSSLAGPDDLLVVGPQAAVAGALIGGYAGTASSGNWGLPLVGALAERLGRRVPHMRGCAPKGGPPPAPGVETGDSDLGVACPSRELFDQAFGAARRAKAIVVTVGLEFDNQHAHPSQTVERECWDRTSAELPANASKLVLGLRAANPHAVLAVVLVHGGAIALPEGLVRSADAIVDAWYPGMEGGRAISDVLFGDYNPAGRSGVTWYRSDAQLPRPSANASYRLPPLGLTYRFFNNEAEVGGVPPGPLFPFGFGLSYTEFSYSALSLGRMRIHPCDTFEVSLTVSNTGQLDGDEVVQVYVKQPDATVPVPRVRLVAFDRIAVRAGASRQVRLAVRPQTHAAVLDGEVYDGSRVVVERGRLSVFVGGGQPDFFKGGLTGEVLVEGTSAVRDCKEEAQLLV